MAHQVRSQVLIGYASLARACGVAPDSLLDSVGLSLDALSDLDGRISTKAFAELLERTADAANVDDFGLRLAMSRSLGILGPVGLVARDEADVRAALSSLARYAPVHNDALQLQVTEDQGQAKLTLAIEPCGLSSIRQVTELTVGAFYRIMRQFLGVRWSAVRVCFTHYADLTGAHKNFFGCPIKFDQDSNCIVCRSAVLDTPMHLADSALAMYAHRYLESIVQPHGAPTGEKVREIVRLLLPSGQCTADRVARRLGVDRRTVHRDLAAFGQTFSSVLLDVRKDLATNLLRGPVALCEIARLLGFSGAPSFSRWFKLVFGRSPSGWRSAQAPYSAAAGVARLRSPRVVMQRNS